MQAYVTDTFRAFVDAIIPYTPELSARLGPEHAPGALGLHLESYMIWTLDHFMESRSSRKKSHQTQGTKSKTKYGRFHLSAPTAKVLDIGAIELLNRGMNHHSPTPGAFPNGGPFTYLSQRDRIRALSLLETGKFNPAILPEPYRNDLGFVHYMIALLPGFCLMGYYSEWVGYGSTRFDSPAYRKLEFSPFSWKQVRYPGPSFGYTDFRGYELDKFSE